MYFVRYLLIILLSLFLMACAHPYLKDNKSPYLGQKPSKGLNTGLETFEQDIGDNWGLALSGGGLRSALFTMGVLKGLKDQDILERIDIVSSVSGGGYAAYWLYSGGVDGESSFGDARLGKSRFPEQTCEILTRGNFVTYQNALANSLSADKLYENSIRRTFGLNKIPQDYRISNLTNKKPYHIVNTTVVDKEYEWKDRLFEITARGYGNPYRGMFPWADENESPTYLQSIATSGAAFMPLRQNVIFPDSAVYSKEVMLTDGGKTENLGAYALIRRGVKNIVIIDAEHNPDMEFSAYKILKLQLQQDGYEFSVPEIDAYINNQIFFADVIKRPGDLTMLKAANEGFVKPPIGPIQTVYYYKMAISRSTNNSLEEESLGGRKIDFIQGKVLHTAVYKALKDHAKKANQNEWDCSILNTLVPELSKKDALLNWYAYSVQEHIQAYPNYPRPKVLNLLAELDLFVGLRSTFPHYTTLDQSFYLNQAAAYMGLGYFVAQELPIK